MKTATRSIGTAANRGTAQAGVALLMLAVAACATDPEPPTRVFALIAPTESRLSWPLPSLHDLPGRFGRFSDAEYREELAQWSSNAGGGAQGGLLLSETIQGRPLTNPADPQDTIGNWRALADKRPFFGELRRLEIDSTTTEWRRAAIGTATCILFVRRLPPPPDGAASTLSGYYCAPPGVILSPNDGAEALRAVVVRPRVGPDGGA